MKTVDRRGIMRNLFLIFMLPMTSLVAHAQQQTDNPGRKQDEEPLVALRGLPPSPETNPTSPEKVFLGKQLFFDPRLSGSNTMSCASCHLPDMAFSDGVTLGKGQGGQSLSRNTQTCLNVGFYTSYFWDGRAKTLEEQALIPIQSAVEMSQDLAELEAELSNIPEYVRQFKEIFDQKPNRDGIAKVLAAYQRSLVTESSPLDRYLSGERTALSDEAQKGLELFRGEAGCVECHRGPLLSDNEFHRLGVSHRDPGREQVTGKKQDRFRFRTPSLRNVTETPPYMHDGSLATLHDVVTFYYRGVPETGPDGLVPDTKALVDRSFSEIPLLVAFLKSLSGRVPNETPPRLPALVKGEPETLISPAYLETDGTRIHSIDSPYQAGPTELRVLLPDRLEADKRYRVVYVLPVEPGRENRYGDGLLEVRKHNLHNEYGTIFVAPSFSGLPWYADHPAQLELRQESYLLRVVIPFVEQTYQVSAMSKDRLLLGFSKSGWGAWTLLLRHPKTFGRAAAWDAPMMMMDIGQYGSREVFGTQACFVEHRVVDQLRIQADVLRGQGPRLILTGFGNFRQHHSQVHRVLDELQIPHEFRDGPQRKHDWHSGWVPEAVKLLHAEK